VLGVLALAIGVVGRAAGAVETFGAGAAHHPSPTDT
jgi:hypothetical protein